MRNILLPTDFSEISRNAVEYALDIFEDVICTFYILNVQKASSFISDEFRSMSPSTTIYQSLIASTKLALNEIIIKLESRKNPNHKFESIVDYDNFIDAINQACIHKEIDIIVMGTKGATGAEQIIFGSNTTRVMQRGIVPVLAVPAKCKFSGIKKIAFTSNYLTHYKEDELTPLMQIAELYDSRIDILHMVVEDHLSEDQKNNKAFLNAFLKYVDHRFIDLEKSDIFEIVNQYVHEHNVDMLAMMSRKHSFLERVFNRQNVETFAFKIDIPMLMMENTGELYKRTS
ncbi:MAG: universal stress protein [Flavobacteriaceae bacterium]|nr:universal stress protein [Bacteroidia bacterium]MBT8288225.1 universal stress protein [Bacteroidia bacterium]NNF76041.1 universal stress protein [Flavobacteriaceae bacterium]NNK73169.1 universal stress protein [Flavobacteriaceae bacterium]